MALLQNTVDKHSEDIAGVKNQIEQQNARIQKLEERMADDTRSVQSGSTYAPMSTRLSGYAMGSLGKDSYGGGSNASDKIIIKFMAGWSAWCASEIMLQDVRASMAPI
eukprot:12081797-Karenia_brevis.AAC.1